MKRKANIWCLGITSLMVFLTVSPAVARDEIIALWNFGEKFHVGYGHSKSDRFTFIWNGPLYPNSSFVDIEAGDISGGGGLRDNYVKGYPHGLWLYNMDARSWKKVNPSAPRRVTAGDLGQDEELEIIAAYGNGIYFFYPSGSGWSWQRITTYVPTGDIAAGDIDGDGLDEVVAGFPTGTWYWNPANEKWAKITSYNAYNLAVGDRNGDGRAEVAGAFPNGIWSWDHGTWRRLTESGYATSGDIAFGDFDGNGKDDLVSCWPDDWPNDYNTFWILYDNGKWANLFIHWCPPDRVSTGDFLLN